MKQLFLRTVTNWLHVSDSLYASEQDWQAVLKLARRYGWQGDDSQMLGEIESCDSFALALALEDALPDVPRHDALSAKLESDEADVINLFEWFSGRPGRDVLESIIRLCRTGSVSITVAHQ